MRTQLGEDESGNQRLQHIGTFFLESFRVEIFWSTAQRCYLAALAGFPGCVGRGPTRESAVEDLSRIARRCRSSRS